MTAGLPYWPGGSEYNTWATVYATHFLVEAKKAGYSVPEGTLKSALSAIATIARSKQTMDYYVYSNHKTEIIRIADKSSVYALYVLALAGQPEVPVMNFYRTAPSLLTTDTRYLLAGSFALNGDRKSFLDLLACAVRHRRSGQNFRRVVRFTDSCERDRPQCSS